MWTLGLTIFVSSFSSTVIANIVSFYLMDRMNQRRKRRAEQLAMKEAIARFKRDIASSTGPCPRCGKLLRMHRIVETDQSAHVQCETQAFA